MRSVLEYCHSCNQSYEGFCKCQTTIIRRVVLPGYGPQTVTMGRAGQDDIDRMRKRIHAAALAQTDKPIEILTLPADNNGNVSFRVRRFV